MGIVLADRRLFASARNIIADRVSAFRNSPSVLCRCRSDAAAPTHFVGAWGLCDQLFQIPVYLDGNIIDLGTSKLLVAEACSGLRYLYPLLCLSFLAAYLFQAPIWQRVIVFLSAIPITIAMNGFRIGLVGILVSRWGAEQAEGLLHLFEGWVIFIACAVLLTRRDFSVCPAFRQTISSKYSMPAS